MGVWYWEECNLLTYSESQGQDLRVTQSQQ